MRLPALMLLVCMALPLLPSVSALRSDHPAPLESTDRKQRLLHPPRKLAAAKGQQLRKQQISAKPELNAEVDVRDYCISDPSPRPFTPWRSGPVEHFRLPPGQHFQTHEANAP